MDDLGLSLRYLEGTIAAASSVGAGPAPSSSAAGAALLAAPAALLAFGAHAVHAGKTAAPEDAFSVHVDLLNLAGLEARKRCGGGAAAAPPAAAAPAPAGSFEGGGASLGDAEDEALSWFAVYDGHGGQEVAQFAAENLHRHFLSALADCCAPGSPASRPPSLPTHSHSHSHDSSSSIGSSALFDRAAWPAASLETEGSDGSAALLSAPATFSPGDLGGRAGSAAAAAAAEASLAFGYGAAPQGTPPARPRGPASPPATPLARAAAAAAAALGAAPPLPPLPPASAAAGLARSASAPCPPPCAPGGRASFGSERRAEAIGRALRRAFARTDRDLAGTEVGDVVGSTALVAVVGRREVVTAHCGDSRAVLCRRGGAVELTSDHKADRPDEAARVRASGGCVVFRAGTHRVMGMLACTRALGDHFLRPHVVSEPEVSSFRRSPGDELLLLATDGLWDAFEPQEAVVLALRSVHRALSRGATRAAACRVAAQVLTRAAAERGSADDITAVVVDLRGGADGGDAAAPTLGGVLAAQCSGEVQLPRAERSGSGGGSGGGGAGGGGGGAGPAGARAARPRVRASRSFRDGGRGGPGGGGGGGVATGDWVFRAQAAGSGARGARASLLRRACTVEPVGVTVAAAGASPPQRREWPAALWAWAQRRDGGGSGGGEARPALLRRSLSFSTVELGRALRHAAINDDEVCAGTGAGAGSSVGCGPVAAR
ncbi:phosphatase 2C [Raphidocelis subcapitata]|uniref:Phosphatase 2C n=1 Tax=Raphidocelis subcapitata TaxID=307507 RepID=A0A2V0NRZ6_9CHLO|nr:phosphatase 2C [Raphidocelis subcapitata]|eukprot:GBF87605.1 phosphatase 2C [Raphidocelis subcapitata]